MKKLLVFFTLTYLTIGCINSQTTEVTFPRVNYDLNAEPRTQLSPMSIKLFDDYVSQRPTPATAPGGNSYGTLLAIYGLNNHWEHNVYFGANKKMYFRNSVYTGWTAEDGTLGGFNDWRTVLDNKSNVESSGLLQISGNGNHYISQGKLGIGTTTPHGNLELAYTSGATLTLSTKGTNGNSSTPKSMVIDFLGYQYGNKARISAIDQTYNTYGSKLSFFVNNGQASDALEEYLTILHTGNVGIGCTNPQSKLTVNGTINATKVEITETVPCSDYVFNSDYNLLSLEEVEQYVKDNKHLPEVPSAEEFKENGYNVGEMDDILLRKVEELTLYTIKQQKELDKKDEIINDLIKRIEALENK